jgi:hypothetical protein
MRKPDRRQVAIVERFKTGSSMSVARVKFFEVHEGSARMLKAFSSICANISVTRGQEGGVNKNEKGRQKTRKSQRASKPAPPAQVRIKFLTSAIKMLARWKLSPTIDKYFSKMRAGRRNRLKNRKTVKGGKKAHNH